MDAAPDSRLGFWHRVTVRYLLAQGLGTALFWVYLLMRPDARPLFWPWDERGLIAFFPPDLLFFVAGSLIAAYGLEKKLRWAKAAVLMVAGATGYAGLYTLLIFLLTGQALIAALLMFVPMVTPTYLAWRLWR